jgi:CelD/BcsL family acetyltransferase involved in cellulose biosynthesis
MITVKETQTHEYNLKLSKTDEGILAEIVRQDKRTNEEHVNKSTPSGSCDFWSLSELIACYPQAKEEILAMLTPWKRIKFDIKEARDIAKEEATSTGWCIRSRGALITAVNSDGDRLDDGGYLITTKKGFFEAVESLKEDGAVSISVEGGYDVAESVRDWGTGDYEPDFSQWSFDYWTK